MRTTVYTARLALLFMALWLAACQPQPPKDMLDALVVAEDTLTSAAKTVHTAVQMGTLSAESETYLVIYTSLERANLLLDNAWLVWRAGNSAQAQRDLDAAMAAYQQIRPLLARYAQ